MAPPFCIPSSRLALALLLGGAALTLQAAPLSQPVAPVRPVTDTYFGTPVVDPYRWMEDLKSPEVQNWMKAQNDYTRDYLGRLPDRDELVKRIEALDNASTRVGGLQHSGSRYFYLKLTPQDQTPKLYVRDGLDAPERLLVDALIGESTLFTRSDEVEQAWRLVDSVKDMWNKHPAHDLPLYACGSMGPVESDQLLENTGRYWIRPKEMTP